MLSTVPAQNHLMILSLATSSLALTARLGLLSQTSQTSDQIPSTEESVGATARLLSVSNRAVVTAPGVRYLTDTIDTSHARSRGVQLVAGLGHHLSMPSDS